MALRNVELYEALKTSVGQDAARMIADVVPPAADLATKHDLDRLGADLRAEMHADTTRTIKWMLGLFIPVWAGTWATVVAVIVTL